MHWISEKFDKYSSVYLLNDSKKISRSLLQENLNEHLKELDLKLPPILKELLRDKVTIVFDDLKTPLNSLNVQCHLKNVHSFRGMQERRKRSLVESYINGRYKIILNSEMLNPKNESTFKENPNCGHRDFKSFVQGAIIHALTEIYLQEMQKLELPKVTDQALFLKFSAFKEASVLGLTSANIRSLRVPDIEELVSPFDYLKINMEYFLLDEKYREKRPIMYDILSREFQFVPFPKSDNASPFSYVLLNSNLPKKNLTILKKIDPAKIYRIDFFLADSGENLMSNWGHAMMRIILCAPKRETPSAKCLYDRSEHIILSFRANQSDIELDALKGLMGDYPARMHLYSLDETVQEYNVNEGRNLYAYPLKLSNEQKKIFVQYVLQKYWGILENYTFLSNNCASELLNIFEVLFPQVKFSKIKSPFGLRDELLKRKIIESKHLNHLLQAGVSQNYFESAFFKLDQKFNRASQILSDRGIVHEHSFQNYVDRSNPKERYDFIKNLDLTRLSDEERFYIFGVLKKNRTFNRK